MCESCTKGQLNTNFTRRCNLIEHFRNRWKLEYITSLREYHRYTGNNRQEIKVGEVVQPCSFRTVKDSSRVHEPSDSKTLSTGNHRTEATSAEGRLSRATKEAAMIKIHKWTS